jgi:hypothetical protein
VLRDRVGSVAARGELVEQPRLAQPGVGERLERPEGLAGDDEERRLRVEAGELLAGIDYDDVIEVLIKEGVDKFVVAWDELQTTLAASLEAARA